MARKCYVGFWPWPRAWTTEEAYNVACSLKKDNASIYLAEPVTEEQAEIFRAVSYEHIASEFELQLCADGLFLYRDNTLEDSIIDAAKIDKQSADPMMGGFDVIMRASSAAYRHYIPALNILFALVESELHSHGRNTTLYWSQPIGRTDMIRVKNAQSDTEISSLTNFGAVNEMQLQRFAGDLSVGARIDGMYYKEVPEAFKDACVLFEKAYNDKRLWSFLEQYANAWSNLQTELYESSLALSWSLIERDLVEQITNLFSRLSTGGVLQLSDQGAVVPLSKKDEKRIRKKLKLGESPMAGQIVSILAAHQVSLHRHLERVKKVRNDHQHKGTPVDPECCRNALTICAEICKRVYFIELNCRLHSNAHLGITC